METLLMKMLLLKATEDDHRVVATVEARVQANSMLTRQQPEETIDSQFTSVNLWMWQLL